MDTIYVEREILDHPRVEQIRARYPRAEVIPCHRYGEVFNLRAQNFRLQKRHPALILARRHGRALLKTPPDYGIGRSDNRYFSHMLNCLYDCRYCFLQGMYQSAHYVHFLNYEDFEKEIDEARTGSEDLCTFSGYDCDSLAMENLTGFARHFVPFFSARPDTWFELRTKSLNTRILGDHEPAPNIIVAFTLTPDSIAREIEHGAPPLERRLDRVRSLTQQGWLVGLRLDPLIPWPGFETLYPNLVRDVFSSVDEASVHSVTLGAMRFPKAMYDRIVRLYPFDPLFSLEEMSLRDGVLTYPPETEERLLRAVETELRNHLPESRIFRQTA